MSAGQMNEPGRLRRGVRTAAVLGVVAGAALAGGAGPAAAAAHPGGASGSGGRPAAPAGTITTIAGGVGGPGPATKVGITPCGVMADGGSIYIPDGPIVRKVNAHGWLTTPAGNGAEHGARGTGGPATKAVLGLACGAAVDHAGNLLIAENFADQVAVAAAATGTFYGQRMTKGHLYLVAGDGRRGYSGSGVVATRAPMSGTEDVAVDAHGNLVITNEGFTTPGGPAFGSLVQVVAARTGTFYRQPMTAGDVYTIAGSKHGVRASGDGGPAARATLGLVINSVRTDRAGNLIVAEPGDGRIRVIAARTGTFYGQPMKAGDIYTVAGDGRFGFSGDGGPAVRAALAHPYGAAPDAAGNLVIADSSNNRIRVVAARTGTFYRRAMKAGDIYTVAGAGKHGFSGDGGPAAAAELNLPIDVAVDGTGNLLIADADNNRLRVVEARAGTFYGIAMKAGDIYTVAGRSRFYYAYSGDGAPATRGTFFAASGMAVNGAGNLVVGNVLFPRVRVIAARAGTFYGVAMKAGDIYTVAGDGKLGFSGDGGPAAQAEISFTPALALDSHGNLVIADQPNGRVRVVAARAGTFYGVAMKAGDIYTVAGDGRSGFTGDGGPATRADLSGPEGVAVNGAGDLFIADTGNIRVRMVTP